MKPDKGIGLWPIELGFFRDPFIENILKHKESIFFADYISETTTFLRFHFKCRLGKILNKKRFIQNCIQDLLYYASLENRFNLMRDVIQVSLNMLGILKK